MSTRLLLVDDDDDVRLTLAANLELDGFTIIEAESAERALKLVVGERPDVVLTDVRMTGMNGVDMFLLMRQRTPDLPVILTTAFSSEELVGRALLAGVFTVLPKPCELGRAVRTLRRAASNPSVMIVDDIAHQAEALAASMQAVGVRARAAPGVDDAIDLVRAGGVDVLVAKIDESLRIDMLRGADPAVSVIAFDSRKIVDPYLLVRTIANARAETVV